jgi:hypothetical protein
LTEAPSGAGDSAGGNDWMNYLGGRGERVGGRTRDGDRPGSRGRVIEEYEVKKEV